MMNFDIQPLSAALDVQIQAKIDHKTKPLGALGTLESLAMQIARVQQSMTPRLIAPTIALFAGDHGIAESGLVNPFPQVVTQQMVLNFCSGGAAINVFAKQNKIDLKIIDAGVNCEFDPKLEITNYKIAKGTANYLYEPAMSSLQCLEAIKCGGELIDHNISEACNVIGFGEMGIGNTSSSALLMSVLCGIPIENCVGNGTGVNPEQYRIKLQTLKDVLAFHHTIKADDVYGALSAFGGFEIVQMCGAMLRAAEKRMLILVDGFISSVALLCASKINANVIEYAIFCHHSSEKGHEFLLNYLNVSPLVNLGMRLGEGSGIAVVYPLIQAACSFFNDMASFESAEVSGQL